MKTVAAGAFKGRCLRLMDEVRATRRPLIITKRGRPVAKLVPPDDPRPRLLGCLAGIVEIAGDAPDAGAPSPTGLTSAAGVPTGSAASPAADDWKVW